jgi:hypothetical protein
MCHRKPDAVRRRQAAQPALMTAEPAVDPAADTGGWGESITERPADANCEIDVVECVEDKEAFLQRYVDGNRPVLLRGFLHGEARCTGGSVVGGDGNESASDWPRAFLARSNTNDAVCVLA